MKFKKIAFLALLVVITSAHAGLRTIVNSSKEPRTFYAYSNITDASRGNIEKALGKKTISAQKSGTIDIGANNGCVFIGTIFDPNASRFAPPVASGAVCEGGQQCWDGERFGWQAWGLPCNLIYPTRE